MRRFLSNWSLLRVMRLGLGSALLYSAIAEQNWLPGLLGSILLYQAVMNVGCAMGNCAVPPTRSDAADTTVEYEEVTPAGKP